MSAYPLSKLGELCEMDRQGLRPDDPLTAQLPFVGVENVGSNTGILDFDTDLRIGSQKSTAFRFDERHVLYAKIRPYLNKVATPGFAGRCSTELVPLLPRDGVDRDFLAYLLRHTETVEFAMSSVMGARMPRTDMQVLMSMPVPLPPLNEQRRIASILNRAARIESLRTQSANRFREFIPALFIKMFGDPVENPLGWPVIQLGELCEMDRRGLQPDDPEAARLPFVGVENVVSGTGSLDFDTDSRVGNQRSTSFRFDERHVLYAKLRPYLNKVATPGFAGRCSPELVPLLPREGADRDFLAHLLRREEIVAFVMKSVTGARMPRTDMKVLMSMPVPLPPPDQQRCFADIVRRATSIADNAKSASESALALTASLMARLLRNGM